MSRPAIRRRSRSSPISAPISRRGQGPARIRDAERRRDQGPAHGQAAEPRIGDRAVGPAHLDRADRRRRPQSPAPRARADGAAAAGVTLGASAASRRLLASL